MKPIHLATGYFLALTGYYFRLEWLNKAAVISHKDGLRANTSSAALVDLLRADQRLGDRIDVAKLNFLRNQLNAVVDNDAAVFAAYRRLLDLWQRLHAWLPTVRNWAQAARTATPGIF